MDVIAIELFNHLTKPQIEGNDVILREPQQDRLQLVRVAARELHQRPEVVLRRRP
jgi:hypothetical protein